MTTKRNLERRLDDLDNGSDYPDASIAELLSSDTYEVVDPEWSIVRLDWGLYHVSESLSAVLNGD